MEILYFIAGAGLVFVLAYFILKSKLQKQQSDFEKEKQMMEQNFIQQKFELEKEKSLFEDRNQSLMKEKEELLLQIQLLRAESGVQSQQLARAEADFANLQEKLESQKKEMENLQQKFTTEFENIASKILKQNTTDFSAANHKNISDLLSPLKEKIQVFEKKVEDTYEKGLKDQTDLKAELKKLHDLNLKISDEANNLTKALKGDVKKQGNWGEMILERILERSGLTEGREFRKQESVLSENGQRFQPDVVIHLPDGKKMVIDSKVSLTAYEQFVNSDDDYEKSQFLKEHVNSLKRHIEQLSEKCYEDIYKMESPDFVLLFIPIEPAFAVALNTDNQLYNKAFERNIVIVTPTTLLATLRTIDSMWNNEKQQRNAIEIARQAGALYDKFEGFITDLTNVGKKMDEAKAEYKGAMNKLFEGKGNLIISVEKLKKMGAKSKKSLPQNIIERAEEIENLEE